MLSNHLLKKHLTFKTIALAVSVSMLSACGGGSSDKPFGNHLTDDGQPTKPEKPSTPETPTKPTTPKKPTTPSTPTKPTKPTNPKKTQAKIVTNITDEKGNAIVGATVEVAGKTATTNTTGKATIETTIATDKKSVILVKKAGYLTTAKEIMLDSKNQSTIDITLFKDQVTTSFASASGATIENPNKTASVDIPANAVVDAKGVAYTGNVNVAMSYYSPEQLQGVQAFAQPYEGVQDDGSGNVGLISVGVTEVKLTDDAGNPLQLNGNAKATLTYPANSVSADTDSIPLWYYDEKKKIWVEDGVATKQADGSYKGEVTHFTLWNLDIPIEQSAKVKGCYQDKQGKPIDAYSLMRTTGWSNSGYTTDGVFEVLVPANKAITLYPSPYSQVTFKPISIAPLAEGEVKDLTNNCFVVSKGYQSNRMELPPIALDNSKVGVKGKKIIGNVITDIDGIDYDPNGDDVSVTGFTVAGQDKNYQVTGSDSVTATIDNVGVLTLSADGSYEFVPNASYVGNVVITYSIADGNGGSATADLNLKVNEPVTTTPLPVNAYVLGYDFDFSITINNNKLVIDDLILNTQYVDNGKLKSKFESIVGKSLSDGYHDLGNNFSYTLTDKKLINDKQVFENNTFTTESIIITEVTDSKIKAYHEQDNELTIEGYYGFKDISGKDIMSLFGNDYMSDTFEAFKKLPKNERVFPNNQKCKYEDKITKSKAYIDIYISDDTKGTKTIEDLKTEANIKFGKNSISGNWAGIPWVASTKIDDYGEADVFVLFNGNVEYLEKFYNQKGTFKSDSQECDFYTKEQVDFAIKAIKKAYPELN